MFLTFKKQKDAQRLIEEAKEIVEKIDKKCELELDRVEKILLEIESIKSHLLRKRIKRTLSLIDSINGADKIEPFEYNEKPYKSRLLKTLNRVKNIEPISIKNIKSGKIKAFLILIFAFLITCFILLSISLSQTSTIFENIASLSLDHINLNSALQWLGGEAIGLKEGSIAIGIGVLLSASTIVGAVLWFFTTYKVSNRNLADANISFNKAKEYKEQKEEALSKISSLKFDMLELKDVFEAFDIFLEEYNAILRRVQYTEGKDIDAYSQKSKEIVKRATLCAQAAIYILKTEIVDSKGELSENLKKSIKEGLEFKEALTSQKPLPNFEKLLPAKNELPSLEIESKDLL